MLSLFLQGDTTEDEDLLKALSEQILSTRGTLNSKTLYGTISTIPPQLFDDFKLFIQQMACTDNTWKFWVQFVFQDILA